MTVHKPTAPFYAVAAAALGYAALFPLYRPVHFALLAAISLAVFFGVTLLCRGAAPKTAPAEKKPAQPKDRAAATGVKGENIDSLLAKVEGMMRTVVAAFEKQLDSLFGSENLDISTDITVLETMMAREGLVGDQLHAQGRTEPPDDGIKLEL